MFPFLRIKWLRYAATGLSVVILGGGIILAIVLFIQASNIVVPEGKNSDHGVMEGFFAIRLVCLFIVLHAFFHYYWGKILCECFFRDNGGGDTNTNYDDHNNNHVDNNYNDKDDSNSSPSSSLPHHDPPHHAPPHHVPPHHGPPPHGPPPHYSPPYYAPPRLGLPHLGPPHHFI